VVLADAAPLGLLWRARHQLGLTQACAADRLGRSPAWLSQREAGSRRFGWNELVAYEALLGVELDWGAV
jgi:transcriptional regulator with XRE-family HTH domain